MHNNILAQLTSLWRRFLRRLGLTSTGNPPASSLRGSLPSGSGVSGVAAEAAVSADLMASFEEVSEACAKNWDQGDIAGSVFFPLEDDEAPGVLLTPACDIEQQKVEAWTFVEMYRDVDVLDGMLSKVRAKSSQGEDGIYVAGKDAFGNAENIVRNLLLNKVLRYHWLPVVIGEHRGWVADFQSVTSLPVEAVSQVSRVCRLRSSWREQLCARYSAFMGRVGTPEYEKAQLDEAVSALLRSAKIRRV
jgi:hypothetical protein